MNGRGKKTTKKKQTKKPQLQQEWNRIAIYISCSGKIEVKVEVVGSYDILSINNTQTHSMNKTEGSFKSL